jgi:THUMP domain-like
LLHEHLPNLLNVKNDLLASSEKVLAKLSPLVDLTYLKESLPEVAKIWVISELNEVKEVLVLLEKQKSSIQVIAVDLNGEEQTVYQNKVKQLPLQAEEPYDANYLFEPAKVLIKGGLSHTYASDLGLQMIDQQSHYFMANNLSVNALGRYFKIHKQLPVNWKKIKNYLKEKDIRQISIAKRNFPESVETIRKRIGINDGSALMLLFTTNHLKRKICFLAERVTDENSVNY